MGTNTSNQNSFSRTMVYEIVRDAVISALEDNNTVTVFVNFTAMMDVVIDNLVLEADILCTRAVTAYQNPCLAQIIKQTALHFVKLAV